MITVDVDDNPEIADKYNVKALPTFLVVNTYTCKNSLYNLNWIYYAIYLIKPLTSIEKIVEFCWFTVSLNLPQNYKKSF